MQAYWRQRLAFEVDLKLALMVTAIFEYSFIAFVTFVVVFNLLYFFVVLPRLTSSRVKLDGDVFVTFRQQRYVNAYLQLLSDAEKNKWHNVLIRNSFAIGIAVWLVGVASLLILRPA